MNVGRWVPVLLWCVGVLIVTSIPNPQLPVTISSLDKVGHFVMYAGLGLLVARAVGNRCARTAGLTALLVIAMFAALDEWHQRFIPGRMGAPADWVADVLGAASGFVFFCAASRRRETL